LFHKGTLVSTKDAKKPIETIRLGEKVISKNEITGELEYKTVTKLFENEVTLLFKLTMSGGKIIETTWNHPFMIKGRGWTLAKDLQIGDESILQDGRLTQIQSIQQIHVPPTKVYNIEVEDFHTYFVGEDGVWVHNYQLTGTNFGLGKTIVDFGNKVINIFSNDKSDFDLKNGSKVPFKNGKITSESGLRTDPVTQKVAKHGGLDYAIKKGTKIPVVEDGTVVRAEGSTKNDKQATGTKAFGAFVEVKHSNGISTLYAHNSKLLVKPGDKVKAGDIIALSGNSGKSIGKNGGYHLHYEVRENGKKQNPLDYNWRR